MRAWTCCCRCGGRVDDAAFCGPCLAWYAFERTATELQRMVADGLWPPPVSAATRGGAPCDGAWPYSAHDAPHGPSEAQQVSEYPVAAPPRPGAWWRWLAASVYAVRGWWWLGTCCNLWVSLPAAWRYAHRNYDWERYL